MTTDAGLVALLTVHGATWRRDHDEAPVVDWARVTRPSLGWTRQYAAAGITAAVIAAIGVAVVIDGHHHPPAARPVVGESAPDPSNPELGAPVRYFGMEGGGIHEVDPGFGESRQTDPLVVAAGGTGQGTTLYDVRAASPHDQIEPCRSVVEVTSYVSGDLLHGRAAATAGQPRELTRLKGEPAPVPVAVSEPAGELAIVTKSQGCHGPDQIDFLRLRDGSVIGRETLASAKFQIDGLAWSAAGDLLAYRIDPAAYSGAYDPPVRAHQAISGTHVLNIHDAVHALDANPKILPSTASGSDERYGPVFWWHGGWAATMNGSLYRLDNRGGLSAVVATDFPTQVDSISSDSSGEHLLITSGSAAYRWDYGRLTPLPGHYFQPVW